MTSKNKTKQFIKSRSPIFTPQKPHESLPDAHRRKKELLARMQERLDPPSSAMGEANKLLHDAKYPARLKEVEEQ